MSFYDEPSKTKLSWDTANHANRTRQNVMAFIPARGGSKGLCGKNLSLLGGIPLMAHAVLAAQRCPAVTRVVVSTDCVNIAAAAREWGADLPFLRPSNLAGDQNLIGSALDHSLTQLMRSEGYAPEAVVVLLPTHPFRSPDLMHKMGQAVLDGFAMVRTVRRVHLRNNTLFFGNSVAQTTPIPVRRTGATICHRSYGIFDAFRRTGASRGMYLHEISGPFELLDIDTAEDLARARSLWPVWREKYGDPA